MKPNHQFQDHRDDQSSSDQVNDVPFIQGKFSMIQEQAPSILIVDDVAENIQIVAGVLKDEGYSMAFATSGSAALDSARNNPFDLILLDVMMPEMDGFETCRRLKADPETADSTVIFLTAKTDLESVVRGFELGGRDYITKPFNSAELSARVRTHVELKRNAAHLEKLNSAKDRFISILANELKGPFVGLNGVLKMVDEQYDVLEREMLRDYISLSRKASDQLLELVENLLTWSSMRTDGLPFAPRPIDLSESINQTASDLKEALESKELVLDNQVEEGSFAFADEGMTRIVLKNLLTNAAMFTQQGGSMGIEAQAEADRLKVRVWDTGVGISEEDRHNLFHIDKRVKRKGTAGEMGTGMGLIVCRELIERNGGEIWLTSQPGQGTEVFFTLPRNETAQLDRTVD
jgi:signal transduction histidine kinase